MKKDPFWTASILFVAISCSLVSRSAHAAPPTPEEFLQMAEDRDLSVEERILYRDLAALARRPEGPRGEWGLADQARMRFGHPAFSGESGPSLSDARMDSWRRFGARRGVHLIWGVEGEWKITGLREVLGTTDVTSAVTIFADQALPRLQDLWGAQHVPVWRRVGAWFGWATVDWDTVQDARAKYQSYLVAYRDCSRWGGFAEGVSFDWSGRPRSVPDVVILRDNMRANLDHEMGHILSQRFGSGATLGRDLEEVRNTSALIRRMVRLSVDANPYTTTNILQEMAYLRSFRARLPSGFSKLFVRAGLRFTR